MIKKLFIAEEKHALECQVCLLSPVYTKIWRKQAARSKFNFCCGKQVLSAANRSNQDGKQIRFQK